MTTKPKLPLLKALCWNIAHPDELSEIDILNIYQRYWRWQKILAQPSKEEIEFITLLTKKYQSYPLIDMSIRKEKQYQYIRSILALLDTELLKECKAYLGGGILNNLEMKYYRYSADIDFICSSLDGYRQLKRQLKINSHQTLFNSLPPEIRLTQIPKIDQYGIRFPILIEDVAIKLEIIVENRINLDNPVTLSDTSIPSLSVLDRFALKLMANADRYLDSSVHSRDLIDIAVLRIQYNLLNTAMVKAETVYDVLDSLTEAILHFQKNSDYRDRCYRQLQIDKPWKIINGLDLLAKDLGLNETERTFSETDFSYLE